MRKIIGIFLSFVLMFVFTSCGNDLAETEAQTETVVEAVDVDEVEVEVEEPTEAVEEPTAVEEPEETITVFAGSINQKYLIHMTIVQNGVDVIGSYYYDSRKIDIPFTGVIESDELFITTDDGSETFKGKITDKQINGMWTMGDTVYDFDLIVESTVDTSTYAQASLLEETIIEFNLVETGERVGVYVDNNKEYIVFRLAKDGNVVVEGPSFDLESWNSFEYYSYHRGGGAGNEGLDTDDLYCKLGLVTYNITQEYSAVEDKTSYSLSVEQEGNIEELTYIGDETSVVGDLSVLGDYEIFKN